jgi:hypothetical protein
MRIKIILLLSRTIREIYFFLVNYTYLLQLHSNYEEIMIVSIFLWCQISDKKKSTQDNEYLFEI